MQSTCSLIDQEVRRGSFPLQRLGFKINKASCSGLCYLSDLNSYSLCCSLNAEHHVCSCLRTFVHAVFTSEVLLPKNLHDSLSPYSNLYTNITFSQGLPIAILSRIVRLFPILPILYHYFFFNLLKLSNKAYVYILFPLGCKLHRGKNFCLFYSILCPRHLE